MIDILPNLRSLPYSEESERAVLGGLLLEPARYEGVAGRLAPEDFYLERHQVLFRAMKAAASRFKGNGHGPDIDVRTLQALLEEENAFEVAGGLAYLATLDLDLPDVGRLDAYVEIVKERSLRRRVIQQAGEMIRRALNGGEDAGQILGQTQAILQGLEEEAAPQSYRSLAELSLVVADAFDARWTEGEKATVVTPWENLNEILDHLEPGEILLVCGAPGAGKTSFMVQVMEHAAFVQKKGVGVISLEMKATELVERLVSRKTGLPFRQLRSFKQRLSSDQMRWAVRALTEWNSTDPGIEIDDHPFQTALDISSRLRRLHRCRRGVDLFMIDYAGLIQLEQSRNRDLELMRSVNIVKGVAKELHIPCVVFAQMNHEAVQEAVRGKKARALAQTAGGTALPQAAYAQLYLFREVNDDGQFARLGQFVVAKHRGGPTGTADVEFDGPTMEWRERPKEGLAQSSFVGV